MKRRIVQFDGKKDSMGAMCVWGGLMGYDRDDYIGNLMLPKV